MEWAASKNRETCFWTLTHQDTLSGILTIFLIYCSQIVYRWWQSAATDGCVWTEHPHTSHFLVLVHTHDHCRDVTLAQGVVRVMSSCVSVHLCVLIPLRLSILHSSQSLSSSYFILLIFIFIFHVRWFGELYIVRFRGWGVRHCGRQQSSHTWRKLRRGQSISSSIWTWTTRTRVNGCGGGRDAHRRLCSPGAVWKDREGEREIEVEPERREDSLRGAVRGESRQLDGVAMRRVRVDVKWIQEVSQETHDVSVSRCLYVERWTPGCASSIQEAVQEDTRSHVRAHGVKHVQHLLVQWDLARLWRSLRNLSLSWNMQECPATPRPRCVLLLASQPAVTSWTLSQAGTGRSPDFTALRPRHHLDWWWRDWPSSKVRSTRQHSSATT